MTDVIHLTDLAKPTFSPEAQQIIDGMAAMADYCPLTADALHEQASAQTGLTDFGENKDYREPMAVLLACVRRVAAFDGVRPDLRLRADADLPQRPTERDRPPPAAPGDLRG